MVLGRLFAASLLLAASARAATPDITIINRCDHVFDLVKQVDGIRTSSSFAPGANVTHSLVSRSTTVFRSGFNPVATLAEFFTDTTRAWYDISIIPEHGSGKKGFNMPLQIAPVNKNNVPIDAACKTITCMADGCPDAYLFPDDDSKTRQCPAEVDFVVTFCPA